MLKNQTLIKVKRKKNASLEHMREMGDEREKCAL